MIEIERKKDIAKENQDGQNQENYYGDRSSRNVVIGARLWNKSVGRIVGDIDKISWIYGGHFYGRVHDQGFKQKTED